MRTRLPSLTLFIWSMCSILHAQHDYLTIIDSMSASGATFDAITQAVETSWDGKFQGKHSGRKQYERWKFYNSTRLDEHGRLLSASKANWDEFYSGMNTKQANKASNPFSGNWESKKKTAFDHLPRGYSGGMGRVNCIAFDPADNNIIYIGTPGGGLWRTTDEGASWNPMIDGMPRLGVSSIVIDPSSPIGNRTIYIMTGDGDGSDVATLGVYKSIDNGATWMSTGLNSSIKDGYKLLMHPIDFNTLYAATEIGVYKTTNGGLNWSLQMLPDYLDWDKVTDLEFHTAHPEILYAATLKGGIYKTLNGGQSWIKLSGTVLPTEAEVYNCRAAIAVSAANPDYLYVLYSATLGDYRFSGVYRSTDEANSFTLQADYPNILGGNPNGYDDRAQPWYDLCITASPLDANEVHVGSINGWKSIDGGVTWSLTADWVEYRAGEGNYTHADFHAFEWDTDNNLYCGTDGGIYKSTDFAENWSNLSFGLEITQFYRIGGKANNPDLILGGAQDNGSILMDNTNTMHQWFGADGFECMFNPSDDAIYYGSYQYGGLIKTTNFGENQFYITPKENGEDVTGNWLTPYLLDPNDSETIYAGYADIYKSTNGGVSWTNITQGAVNPNYKFNHLRVSRANSNYIYALKAQDLYRSTDSGTTWSEIDSQIPQNWGVSGFTIDPDDVDKIWAYNYMGVYKTTDGGSSWSLLTTSGLPSYTKNTLVFQEGSNDGIYLGTDVGVYYIDNNMTSWLNFSDGLINVEIYELEINYMSNKIRAATYGRGVWESDLYINCDDGVTISIPQAATKANKANKAVGDSYTIEAENFTSTGGTYNDSPYGGSGLGVNNAGNSINYVNTGDWAQYNLPANFESGTYVVDYYIGTTMNGAAIALSVDNEAPSITDAVPNNNNWEDYQVLRSTDSIPLQQGVNTSITLTGAGTETWEWNLDRFVLTKIADLHIPVDSITLPSGIPPLELGTSYTLTANLHPNNASNSNLSWTSSNHVVASVNNGVVSANTIGTAVITVTSEDGNHTATCTIQVIPAPYTITMEAESRASILNTFPIYQSSAGLAIEAENGQFGMYSLPSTYESGMYRIEYHIGSAIDGARITFKPDHLSTEEVVELSVPNLGVWDRFEWIVSDTCVNLENGRNYNISLTAQGPEGKVLNLDKFRLVRVGDLNIPVQSLTVDGDSTLTLTSGAFAGLRAILTPAYATENTIQWESSNENIAAINDGPYYDAIHGISTINIRTANIGTATITAKAEDGDYSATFTVHVEGDGSSVVDVHISDEQEYLAVGDTYQLTAKALPETATNKNISWTTDNEAVATISPEGLVTAHAIGDAVITVTTEESSYTANCTIQVTAANAISIEAESRAGIPGAYATYSSSAGMAIEAEAGEQGAYQLPSYFASGSYQVEYFIGSAIDGASIEFRSDYMTDPLVTEIPNAGDWDVFEHIKEKQTVNLHPDRNYNVFLRAQGPDGKVLNMDKFRLLRVGDLDIPVQDLIVSGDSIFTIETNHAQELRAQLLPAYANNTTITWTSSDDGVISIPDNIYFDSQSGISSCIVDAVNEGNAVITATSEDGEHTARFYISVIPEHIDVSGIILSDYEEEVNLGDSYQLTATIQPQYASNQNINWSSDDEAVATVSNTGMVSTAGYGTAIITATTEEGNYTASCTIEVPSVIELTIEAENFITTGGTTDDTQWGGPGFGVNPTETNINWVNTNDWATYQLNIAEAGKYEVEYVISTPINGAAIELSFNGNAYHTDAVPANGEWDNYQYLLSDKYYELYPGAYTVQVKGVGTDGWEWNLDKFSFTKVDEICVSPVNLKTVNRELPGTYAGPMPGLIQEITRAENEVDVTTEGVDENYTEAFSIFPNPASDQLTLSFHITQNHPVSIRIMSIVGATEATVISNESLKSGAYEMNYDISFLNAGIYLVHYNHDGHSVVQKLIIE